MVPADFAAVMAYIGAAVGKPMPPETVAVYFDLLGDLPLRVLKIAAQRVLLEHRWATFPTIAEIREAAMQTARGKITDLSASEAWAIAWRAIGRIDPGQIGSEERHLARVPPLVSLAIQTMGVRSLCFDTSPLPVIRAQFMKVFEEAKYRQAVLALMPAAVKAEIGKIGAAPPKLLEGIGRPAE